MNFDKGSRFADRFTILATAGRGGTANVYQAFDDETSAVVALKIFSTDNKDPDVVSAFWAREHTSLSKLSHDVIVKLIDAGRDPTTDLRYLVLEWIDGITLEEHFTQKGALDWESFLKNYGKPILEALVHALENNVSHRDLSTGNIVVLPNTQLKIIDFGQSKATNLPLGRTVSAWQTPPYCPPEPDTGTYTFTRDPFSLCAIAVRALSGRQLNNHEELYDALENVSIPDEIRATLKRAMSREPRERYENAIAFERALAGGSDDKSAAEVAAVVPIRILPAMLPRIIAADMDQSDREEAFHNVVTELNDVITVTAPKTDVTHERTRLEIETQSYRMIVDIDRGEPDHLVIVDLIIRRFRLESLYQSKRWMPKIQFTEVLPARKDDKTNARESIQALYRGLEEFDASSARDVVTSSGSVIAGWGQLLEALRYIASHEIPPLKYSDIETDRLWLTATVENPEDAEEGQIRTITVDKRWVFRGEIDSVKGNSVTLVSTGRYINPDLIPRSGKLDSDWQLAKTALDRQARAVEKFKTGDTPARKLCELLTGTAQGPEEPSFANVALFFDGTLDADKKAIVSRSTAGIDLLVTHGPPGTGKTKLIVELIRQALQLQPEAKILLVSQTHAALDNALERLLKVAPNVPCVRIGSGTKESDPRVANCTVDAKKMQLLRSLEKSSVEFLEERAKSKNIDKREVEMGLRALNVLERIAALNTQRTIKTELETELAALTASAGNASGAPQSTSDRSDRTLRARVLEEQLGGQESAIQAGEQELVTAREQLRAMGGDAVELSRQPEAELRDWSEMLMRGQDRKDLGELMKLSEQWRLTFGESSDCTAAIITSASVVAGTCVGFCREEAASKVTYDLCIIDEAGKATTTELLVPLAQSKRAILVGDHHQLPAVVDHDLCKPDLMDRYGLTKEQIEVQLFESLTSSLGKGGLAELNMQYRMRGSIGDLISKCFYNGKLASDESLKGRNPIDLSLAGVVSPVTWLDPYKGRHVSRSEQQVGTSYANLRERQCILWLLKRIKFVYETAKLQKPWPTIGIITGYAAQAGILRNEMRSDSTLDDMNIECSTVHTFQGREVDICIYSVTRKNAHYRIGMLSDWRHLNVALSRAKDYLIVVGDLEFCRVVPERNPFAGIVQFIESSPDCAIKEWADD